MVNCHLHIAVSRLVGQRSLPYFRRLCPIVYDVRQNQGYGCHHLYFCDVK